MAITINKPLVLATSQSYHFLGVTITKQNNNLIATVLFGVQDQTGKQIDTKTLTFTGIDYNAFWTAFNTGTFLYQELAKALDLPNSQIPGAKTQESEFLNPTH